MAVRTRKIWNDVPDAQIKEHVDMVYHKTEDDECPVDSMKLFTDEIRRDNCGKCVICREGILQINALTSGITQGTGKAEDLNLIEEIADNLIESASCIFGQAVGTHIKVDYEKNREIFEMHVKRNRCDALICKSMFTCYIDPAICQGSGKCTEVCPEDAIAGNAGEIHVIDSTKCSRCGACATVCANGAIKKAGAVLPKLPEQPIPVGSFQAEGGGLLGGSRRRRRKN